MLGFPYLFAAHTQCPNALQKLSYRHSRLSFGNPCNTLLVVIPFLLSFVQLLFLPCI